MQGVYKGYGGTFADFKFNSPDYDKLMHIEKNVYSFAAAKNWQMLKELTMAIKDGDKTLSFNEFKQKASKILTDYDVNYLRTEYNAAIAGAQMASKWVDFERAVTVSHAEQPVEGQPLLEYRTQEDIRVRPEHAALDKITRPVNDPFWNTYYPPNGWNCRCTVIRLPYSKTNKPSTQKEVNHATADCTPQKGFATNLAKSGFVFPKTSAYFIGLPQEIEINAERLLFKSQQKFTIDRLVGKVEVKRKELPSPVIFSKDGIKHAFNEPNDHKAIKNSMLQTIDKVLEIAEYKGFTTYPEDNPGIKGSHIFDVLINNHPNFIIAREHANGAIRFYSISQHKKVLHGIKKSG